jgi:hypothetical protein
MRRVLLRGLFQVSCWTVGAKIPGAGTLTTFN